MKKILTLLFLFAALYSNATIFYIDPTGNDATGTGAIGNPWKTLFKACSTVSGAGDIIHVNAGTYTETAQCILAVGVSIEGVGVTSIIKSSLTADWTAIIVANSGTEATNGNQHITGIKMDGQVVDYTGGTAWAIEMRGRKNFTIYNCSFFNFRQSACVLAGRTDNAGLPPTTYPTGNAFYSNNVQNCAIYEAGAGQGALMIGGQDGILVYDNVINTSQRTTGHNGWPIKYYNEGYLNNSKIYNNILEKAPLGAALGVDNWDFAIELFRTYGLEIYGNTIINGGIDLNYVSKKTYPYGAYIHDNHISNTVTNNTGKESGIILEFECKNVIIQNNIIEKKTKGIIFTPRNTDSVKNVTIKNNLLKNIGISSAEGYLIDLGGGGGATNYYDSISIYNNTMMADATNDIYQGIKMPDPASGFVKNIRIINNTITGCRDYAIWQFSPSTVVIDSMEIRYNNIYDNGAANVPTFLTTPTHYTYSNNVSIAPSFDSENKLLYSSPLIDAGLNVGLPYVGAAPDIWWKDTISSIPPPCITWDPLYKGTGITLTNNNLTASLNFTTGMVLGTLPFTDSAMVKIVISNNSDGYGIATRSSNLEVEPVNSVDQWVVDPWNGNLRHNGSSTGYGTPYSIGDTMGIAIRGGNLYFFRNSTNFGIATSGLTPGNWYPVYGGFAASPNASTIILPVNAPAGFKDICATVTNVSPTANAGTDQAITLPTSSVTLTGSGSDADGTITAYAWTKLSGTGGTLTTPAAATTTFTGLTAGTYIVQLTVTDNEGATGTDTATITVSAAAPPVIRFKRKLKMN